MAAYFNEIDPYAAQWLRNLIAAGHIAPGDVDERDIRDVCPDDLRGYTQCHFFAGIGVWSYAARRAGWPDDRPLWTGSCPCQPFSAAGKRAGTADERHLWPSFFWLIERCRPRVLFGEQVASKDGLAWLDIVQSDLEGAGYTCGAVDLCAAGVGAPHIRQRLFFVADAEHAEWRAEYQADSNTHGRDGLGRSGNARELGHHHPGLQGRGVPGAVGERERGSECAARAAGAVDCVENSHVMQPEQSTGQRARPAQAPGAGPRDQFAGRSEPGPTNGFWRPADWLPCIDGKARPVEPGTFPLAHGAPARVGRLRAYGNAIVSEAARAFIEAYRALRP